MQASHANSSPAGRLWNLFRALLKQHQGSILLYTGILFAIYTLPTFLSVINEYNFFSGAIGAGHNFSGFGFFAFVVYIMVVPLSLGVRHYGYMHSKRAVDLYHALPVKRGELYLAQTAIGTLTIAVPIAINFGLIMCAQIIMGYGRFVPAGLASMLLWIVAGYVVFALTGFCAVNTGSGLDTTLFAMALNGAPTAIYYLNYVVCDIMLYGFQYNDNAMLWGTRLSPIPTMLLRELEHYESSGMATHTTVTMFVWVLLAVAITVGSLMLYKRRRSEMAEVVGNYGPAQIAIRAMLYYLGAVLFALAFTGIFYDDSGYIFFITGAAVGAFLTGIIGEMILTRSPRTTLKRLPITLGAVVLAIVGAFMYTRGGFGYETFVPDPANVTTVSISFDDGYQYMNGRRSNQKEVFEDPEIIAQITDIHAAQIEGYRADGYPRGSNYTSSNSVNSSFYITYTLKSGKTVVRRYYNGYEAAAEGLIELSTMPAYVERRSEFFHIEPSDIGVIELASLLQDSTESLELTLAQRQALLAAIREDLTNRDGAAMSAGVEAVGLMKLNVSYLTDDDYSYTTYSGYGTVTEVPAPLYDESYRRTQATLYFQVCEGDANTIRFLEENGLMQYLEADFTQVTRLWIIDSPQYTYYYGGLVAMLNVNIADDINYAVNRVMDQKYEHYPYEAPLLPVGTGRIMELVGPAKATTSKLTSDVVILAFRTERSLGSTGFLYISRADLPADLIAELEHIYREGVVSEAYRTARPELFDAPAEADEPAVPIAPKISGEITTPAEPAAPLAAETMLDLAGMVTVGTLRIRY